MLLSFSLDGLKDRALEFVSDNIDLIEPIVFALGFGESLVLVSLFIPSTALFLAIGGLHSAAGGELWSIWLAGSVGAFVGDLVSYALGRYFRRDIGRMWPLKNNPEWYVAARHFTRRWGMSGIIASKFMGAMRPFVPVVAGATGMGCPAFMVASAISCVVWAGVFLSPGYGVMWAFS